MDNAIVVLESIYRHRKEGKGRIEAALTGTKEVGGAIIASTLTTVVVFVPIVFTEGIASEVFKEMALTVTFSLLASLAVALTIVPMLSSKMLNVSSEKEGRNSLLSKIINVWDRAINGLDDIYRVVLKGVLNSRLITIILTIIISGASIATVFFIGTEFIPSTDQGLLTVSIDMGDGILLEETDEVVKKVEEIVDKIPEVEIVFTTVGGSSSNVMSMGTESSSASVDVTLNLFQTALRVQVR